jgi:hypothetical protein
VPLNRIIPHQTTGLLRENEQNRKDQYALSQINITNNSTLITVTIDTPPGSTIQRLGNGFWQAVVHLLNKGRACPFSVQLLRAAYSVFFG